MKVLVCGGAGYIGGATVDIFQKQGHDVTVVDTLMYETRFLKDVPFLRMDIRDTQALVEHVEAEKYDAVIWMAAIVGDGACAADVSLTTEVNFNSLKRFTESCRHPHHFVFMSTCSVYGAQDGVLNEQSPTNPLSAYASTKLQAESVVKKLPSYTILRLGTVFGLGDVHSRLRLDLVVNVLTLHAVRTGTISILGGHQWRPIISVRDVAGYAVEAALKAVQGTYILSYENATMTEMGKRVAAALPGIMVLNKPLPKEDERNYRVDNSLSRKVFTYKPQQSMDEAVPLLAKVIREGRIINVSDRVYHNSNFIRSADWKMRFGQDVPEVHEVSTFVDDRGTLKFSNNLDLSAVKRFYQVKNHQAGFVRAWHGHKKEAKYLYVQRGVIQLALVPMDDEKADPKLFVLSAEKPRIVYIPPGYYNGFETITADAELLFLSTTTTAQSQGDDYRLEWDHFPDVWHRQNYR